MNASLHAPARASGRNRARPTTRLLIACAATMSLSYGLAMPATSHAANSEPDWEAIQAATSGSLLSAPIAPGAHIDPNSPAMVDLLADTITQRGFVVSTAEWTVPVYVAGAATPRADLRVLGRTPGANLDPSFVHDHITSLPNVPIGEDAAPDPLDDGHLTVVDPDAGCVWDLYNVRKTSTGWEADWANATPAAGTGVYPGRLSSRATGFGGLAGAIWPHELRQGRINHALVFNYKYTRAGFPVASATASDGRYDRPDAIPQGALVRLDPEVDVNALDLTPTERTIARALQEFGMYLVDSGGAVGLYAVGAQSFSGAPYGGLLAEPYHELTGLPVERLQVMELGAPQPVSLVRDSNRCTESMAVGPTHPGKKKGKKKRARTVQVADTAPADVTHRQGKWSSRIR